MLRPIDHYFLRQEEPVKSCLLFLRQYILSRDKHITEAWKYGMPFYCYKGKMFCYLWVHKKYLQPYIGFVEGKLLNDTVLLTEKRARMKILLLNPAADIPVAHINRLLNVLLRHYKTTMP